jgi:hypothetical protein
VTLTAQALDEPAANDNPGRSQRTGIAYYHDLELSLAPLLQHALNLRRTLVDLAGDSTSGSPVPRDVAHTWIEDVATTRDLVGRLTPPKLDDADGGHVHLMYVAGTMLYLETARIADIALGTSDRAEAQQIGRAALRVWLIAERAFDQGRRLLNSSGSLGNRHDFLTPKEVPDFTEEQIEPGATGPPSLGGSGYLDRDGAAIETQKWGRFYRKPLGDAADLLSGPRVENPAGGEAKLDHEQLLRLASGLRRVSHELTTYPSDGLAREGAVALRLALLTQAESLTLELQTDEKLQKECQRLGLIGNAIFDVGRKILIGADAINEEQLGVRLTGAALKNRILYEGGLFNGNPPPIAPGESPAKDVPGGLGVPSLGPN